MRLCPNGLIVAEHPDAVQLTGYVRQEETEADVVQTVTETLAPVPSELLPRPLSVSVQTVPERDWVELFRAQCQPLRVGRIVVKPSWEPWPSPRLAANPHDIIIELDPGMAFGTGSHPSTQGCLLSLQRHVRAGARVIDFGCGSGILSIAAALLGAAQVLALDCDPLAVEVARENVSNNGVADRVAAVEASSLAGLCPGWDVIVANISAPVTAAAAAQAVALLRAGGVYICAGIPIERGDEVAAALEACGFRNLKREVSGPWVLLEAQAPGSEAL